MRKRYFFSFLLSLLAMAMLTLAIPTEQITGASVGVPSRPFPQHVTYAEGTIRPTNFTQAQQDQHVRDFYDYWKTNYLVAAGTNGAGQQMYRVAFGVGSDITVSEGQGYGMVIVALMAGHDADAQVFLDGLWYFAREYPSGIDNRLMSWKIQNGTIVDGNDSAFDGDVDIAYGLLLADAQWGSDGAVDYEAEASEVIDGILESTIGESSRLPMLGDWVNDNGSPYNQYTPRSSDFMPAHFRAFGRAKNDTVWETVISNSQAVIDSIQNSDSPVTGLLPDFIINCSTPNNCEPAYAGFLEGAHDGHYYYNAGRDPWRIGLDALLNDDATSRAEVQKMVSWVASSSGGDASQIKAGYQLDGSVIGNYFTTFFVAPFGVGAMLDDSQQQFLNDIYASVYNTQENYYEDSVNLLALLAMTGNYWDPTADSTPSPTQTPGPSPTASNTPTAAPPTATPVGGLCVVTYQIDSQWDVGFTATVTITNNDSNPINGWSLTWTHITGQQVVSAWNATVSQVGNQVTASNPADHWNGTIDPNGGSVSFGFQASYNDSVVIPTNFVLNGLGCNEDNTPPTATSTPTATNVGTATNTPPPTATATPCANCDDFLRVGYLNYPVTGNWSQYNQLFDGTYTHLITTFLLPDSNGNLQATDSAISFDSTLIQQAQASESKVLVSIGGATVSYNVYINIANNPTAREAFINNALAFMNNNGYDGVDINFEGWYDGISDSQLSQVNQLAADLAQAIKNDDASNLVTVAIAPLYYIPYSISCELINTNLIDLAHHMSYDFGASPGGNGPFRTPGVTQWLPSGDTVERSVWGALTYLFERGCQPAKMTAGIPFYTTTHLPWADVRNSADWANIELHNDYLEKQHPTAGYWVNDAESISAKIIEYQNLGLRGVMVWQVGHEGTTGDLSQALYEASINITPTPSPTASATSVPTATRTSTALPTATRTSTALPTATRTSTALPTATHTGTALPTATRTSTALPTETPLPTETALPTASHTQTALPTASHTQTALPTASYTSTPLPTATHTATTLPTATPTNTPPPNPGTCTIDYVVTSQWNTGFNVSLSINNNTGADIEGWTLTWSFAGNQQITSLWNGLYSQDGTQVTVNNQSYNSSLPNGGTQSFGFQGTYSGPNETPSDFVLNGIPCNGPAPTATPEPPTGASCIVDYTTTSDWGVGFVANLIISNNSGTTWYDWTLTWSFNGNQEINNLWNGNVTQTGNQVSVENASWNGNILHGGSVNIGFQASYSGNNTPPSDFAVNGQPCNGITPTPTNTPAPNAPTIEQLLPAQGANSLPNEINLFGNNFEAGSIVSMNLGSQHSLRLGEMPLESTFIDTSHLRVVIPAGLLPQTYNLTVENPDGSRSTLIGGYMVTEAQQDDLFGNSSQLWSIPSALRAGDEAQLGLLVYREGGSETLQNISVSFYLTDENDVQDSLGSAEIALLAPNSSQSTIPLTWTVPALAGDYTLYALIDEANHISETNESNNVIVRPLTILAPASDVTPPIIDNFTINGGASESASQNVTLSISATDQGTPSTGVESIYIIEYEYNQALSLWIPAQLSDWQPYSATQSTYNWTLLPAAGLKYLQLWAADGAGNISLMPQSAFINHLPANASLPTGLSHFYAYDLAAGESLSALLTPVSGDPDLYIWAPNSEQSWFSINEGSEVDDVSLTAPTTGRYMLQIYAYESAEYSLSVTLGVAEASQHTAQGKTPLSEPGLAPEALPDALTHALPQAPLSNETSGQEHKIHLPIIVR